MADTEGALDLSAGEWAVLGLLVMAPRHGFALAKELGAEGRWGRIWTVPRPVVYRALSTLGARGLISVDPSEGSRLGPPRAVHRASPSGEAAFAAWLSTPVAHLRETRSLLLLKLAFLWARGESADSLLAAQLASLRPMQVGLEEKLARADGFERTLALWRLESARTLLRFIGQLRQGAAGSEGQAG